MRISRSAFSSASSALLLCTLTACRFGFDKAPSGDGRTPDGVTLIDASGEPAQFFLGTFGKTPSVGVQVVPHTLGVTPRALIMWTSGHGVTGFGQATRFALGFTDQTLTSRSVGIFSEGNGISDRRISTAAITLVGDNATTLADGFIVAWNATSLTIDWNPNQGGQQLVHFLLIGGGVTSRVVGWTMPDVLGLFSIPGLGFQPDVVLHAHAGAGVMSPPPTNLNQAGFGLGAMTPNGQWATSIFISDDAGTTNTQRGARTDASVHVFDADLVELRRGKYISMDPQGFTLDFDVVGATGTQAFSLALAGVNARVGSFPKGSSPIHVQGIGFAPSALLLASIQDVPRTMPVPHARFGLGAAIGNQAAAVAFSDTDGLAVSSVNSYTSQTTSQSFIKIDSDTQTIDAEFGSVLFSVDSFTIPLPTNDLIPTQIHYVALGAK